MIALRRRYGPSAVRIRPTDVLRAGDGSLADRFTAYVAARLGCAPAAVITPDLSARLAARGVPAELAEATARQVEKLVGARYGGTVDDEAESDATAALVRDIEAAVAARETNP